MPYQASIGPWAALLLGVCASGPAMAASDPRETEIRSHMKALGEAWESGDRAAAAAFYGDDFVDIAFDGSRRGKDEVLAFIRPAKTSAAQIHFAPSDHRFVFPAADVAVVTYRNRDCRDRPEGRRCFDFSASETFVRRSGRWTLVAGQQSMIPPDAATARADVLAVEALLRRAQLTGNAAMIEALHLPDYRLILADGRIVGYDKWVSDVRTGSWRPDAIAYSEQDVRITGDLAVVTGVARSDWRSKDGAAKFARERYTDVYAGGDNAWRKLSTHLSCLDGACS